MSEYHENCRLFDIIERLDHFGQVEYELSSVTIFSWLLVALDDIFDVIGLLGRKDMLQLLRNAGAVPELDVEEQQ